MKTHGSVIAIVFAFGFMVLFTGCSPYEGLVPFGPYTVEGLPDWTKGYSGEKLPTPKSDEIKSITFKADLAIPESLKKAQLAITVGPLSYPIEIKVNGKDIFFAGRWASKTVYNSTYYVPICVPLPQSDIKGETLSLEVVAHPSRETNPIPEFFLSTYEVSVTHVFWRSFANVGMVQSCALLAVILICYFIFLLVKKFNWQYLYIALFIISFAMSYINMSLSSLVSNETLIEIVSRCSYPISLSMLFFFVTEYTGILRKNKLPRILVLSLGLPFIVATLIQPTKYDVGQVFNLTMPLYIAPALFLCLVVTIIGAIRAKFRGYVPLLVAFAAIIFTSIQDLQVVSAGAVPYTYLVVYGYLSLVIAIFFTLASDQGKTEERAVSASLELNVRNERLGDMMGKTREVASSLRKEGSRLSEIATLTVQFAKDHEANNRELLESLTTSSRQLDQAIEGISQSLEKSTKDMGEALASQGSLVKRVIGAVDTMIEGVEGAMGLSSESSLSSRRLAQLAKDTDSLTQRTSAAMASIGEVSSVVSQVLASISDIAEQTDMLSLNAFIEAARSGSHGVGFKVVADNIRKLSALSKQTIATSISRIGQIDALVQESRVLNGKISEALKTVVAESVSSSDKIGAVSEHVLREKQECVGIEGAIQSLKSESDRVAELNETEAGMKRDQMSLLGEMREEFSGLVSGLERQKEEIASLSELLSDVERIVGANAENVRTLNEAIAD